MDNLASGIACRDSWDELPCMMGEFPRPRFAVPEVKRAGLKLAQAIVWDDENREEILSIFEIAHNWRNSHVLPMRGLRASLIMRMRYLDIPGVTVARAKRMASIRRKLQKTSLQLHQIQDLGGCRAIVEDIAGARRLVQECLDRLPHELLKDRNYIDSAKPDGYRSHHLVFGYRGQGDREAFNGRRIELQIRTRLQHSWATAVEAVGLYRGEHIKGGEGDPTWRQFFKLMSDEFAFAEGCEIVRLGPSRDERVKEIRRLDEILGAQKLLENLKNATEYVETYLQPGHASLYLIRYDNQNHSVTVQSYFDNLTGAASFDEAERRIEEGLLDSNVVLVDASQVTALVDAYPNYFGDVTIFTTALRRICQDAVQPEFVLKKQEVAKPKPREIPDLSWFFNRNRRWEDKPKSRK
jgi:Region found in RelA / SpoT proteins